MLILWKLFVSGNSFYGNSQLRHVSLRSVRLSFFSSPIHFKICSPGIEHPHTQFLHSNWPIIISIHFYENDFLLFGCKYSQNLKFSIFSSIRAKFQPKEFISVIIRWVGNRPKMLSHWIKFAFNGKTPNGKNNVSFLFHRIWQRFSPCQMNCRMIFGPVFKASARTKYRISYNCMCHNHFEWNCHLKIEVQTFTVPQKISVFKTWRVYSRARDIRYAKSCTAITDDFKSFFFKFVRWKNTSCFLVVWKELRLITLCGTS